MGNSSTKMPLSEEVDLTHFKLLRCIGRGSFGKVRMVQHKITKENFALKYLDKEDIIRKKMTKNILRERNLLQDLHHPLICNLKYSFQDDYNLYMVLDLMLGGDLRFHMNRRKFTEVEIVKIAAELIVSISHLHKLKVIHRDIKPDNILLDDNGHAHLTDFNIATHYHENKLLTSQSGTTQYMAPEIVNGQGYSTSVDWWSLGICLYELVYGKTPFQDSLKKQKTRQVIVDEQIQFYHSSQLDFSITLLDFISKLLLKDPAKRLGSGSQGLNDLKNHNLFLTIDWDEMLYKINPNPFVPNINQPNFDMTYDLEELLLEDCPLESLPSKRNRDLSTLSGDMLLMENEYHAYDYTIRLTGGQSSGTKGRRHSILGSNNNSAKVSPIQKPNELNLIDSSGLGTNLEIPQLAKMDRRKSKSYSQLNQFFTSPSREMELPDLRKVGSRSHSPPSPPSPSSTRYSSTQASISDQVTTNSSPQTSSAKGLAHMLKPLYKGLKHKKSERDGFLGIGITPPPSSLS